MSAHAGHRIGERPPPAERPPGRVSRLAGPMPVAVLAACLVAAAFAACDPVTDDAISALGGETPGVRRGPLHRPGQPCLLCHDGAIGDPPAFVVAGTIYETPSSDAGLEGATVLITDSTDASVRPVTNAAGNFYLTPEQWSPVFPLKNITVYGPSGSFALMQSDVGRDGACATCHFGAAPSPGSPGHVVVALDDGGTPP